MDAAMACMKYILFATNFFVWCMGVGILGIGVWIRADSDFWEYQDNMSLNNYYQACYLIIAVGTLLLIMGFFGCCGALMESPCMLLTYFILLFIMMLMELAAAGLVWKITSSEKLQIYITEQLLYHVERINDSERSRRFIDLMQIHLQCCGAKNYYDYLDRYLPIPQSCSDSRANNIYYWGCGENLRRYLEQKAGLVGGISLGLGLIQMVALVFSMCLFCAIRQEDKDYI